MRALQPRPPRFAASRACSSSRRGPPPPCAAPARRGAEPDEHGTMGGLTLPGLCDTVGCTMEEAAATLQQAGPSAAHQRQLAQRLAERAADPGTQALAAALAAQQQQQQQQQQQCAGACSASASQDDVWSWGQCARHGDPWCLLQLAAHCARQAAAATTPKRRHYSSMQALRLMRQAAAAVSEADWDVWLRGGAHAALGSFVALGSSAASPDAVAAQLAEVSRLVTGAASEEGGIEMWALQDILQRQEERLALARSMDA